MNGESTSSATSCGGWRPTRGLRGAKSARAMGRFLGAPQHIAAHASPGKLAVLYDGGCEMCRNVAAGVLRYDNTKALELLDASEPAARAQFPELRLDDLLYELHVIDDGGRVYRGARAVNEILRRQAGPRSLLAYLWYLPGF